ncbi:hypothetical protein FHW96_004968 [Novosphingobium sp. SG751A]|uniref:hypothetical protein n=1 Tax=unclassified Novosphingobium TaxID=2644732 RepID=UPI00155368B2|nr:hypothetical protein [Novosphingobium sp. SG720]NMN07616.1 hypothetical protein [Novosphingobium sp. SG919]NMN89926.1 hypothetical protein [Novosphingobium sp. SG916]NOW48778.1 hypothetical protein [Novosphingobium sp. SG751A]
MKILSQDRSSLMEVTALDISSGELVIKGKVFGTMPMSARLSPDEARKGLKLLSPRILIFLLTFLFRSGKS